MVGGIDDAQGQVDRGISPILAGVLEWLKPDAGVVGACLGPPNQECRLLLAFS